MATGRRAVVAGATIALLLAVNVVVVLARTGEEPATMPAAPLPGVDSRSESLGLSGLGLEREPEPTIPPQAGGHAPTTRPATKAPTSTVQPPASSSSSSSTSTTAPPAVDGPGLYVVNADGTGPRKVHGTLGLFTWSPDGTRLAIAHGDIVIVRADGTGRTTLPAHGSAPVWSPDGSRIAFNGSPEGVYVVRADGSRPPALVDPRGYLSAWTPDGRILVLVREPSGGASVVLYDDAGGARRVIASDAGTFVPPAPSPDGRSVAYMSNRLLVAGIDGSGSRPITDTCCGSAAPNSPLRWSPDSRRIAFIDLGDVKVVGADGTGERVLVPRATAPDWSPDGRRIAVSERQGVRADGLIHVTLGVADADGSNRSTVFDAGQKLSVLGPQWSPTGRQLAAMVSGPLNLPIPG